MSDQRPVFLLSCSRSGSTLLRFILDSHHDIAVPPELHLGKLIERFSWASDILHQDDPSLDADALVRETLTGMLDKFVKRQGKKIWCDKSVTSIDSLPVLMECFPNARFICLYRHAMDVVASCINVSRYGYRGYNFESFVHNSLGNVLNGFVDYWCDQTEKLIALETQLANSCIRIRHEDVLLQTEETIRPLFDFLDVPWDSDLLDEVFLREHQQGAGDVNIRSASRIDTRAIGRSTTIAAERISAERIERMNRSLAELQYTLVSDEWNELVPPKNILRESDLPELENAPVDTEVVRRMDELMSGFSPSAGTTKIIVYDWSKGWIVSANDSSTSGFGNQSQVVADCTISMASQTLKSLLDRECHPQKAVNDGRISVSGNYELKHDIWRRFQRLDESA